MAEDEAPPIRLMNFVSQAELDVAKSSPGERLEDGTAQRDHPLFELLVDFYLGNDKVYGADSAEA
ncbi:hypothetical protein SOVF_089810 [Spinacia oleracea]|nr:hypothetical protein SOVF_089810 [Spinacia oleracea]